MAKHIKISTLKKDEPENKLTIMEADSEEPIAVLVDDGEGVSLAGGDPGIIEALDLAQFDTLQEMFQWINASGSEYKAVLEGPDALGAPLEDEEEDDPAFEAALAMINDLVQRVREKRDNEAQQEMDDTAAQSTADSMGGEIIADGSGGLVYVSFDGDSIGNAVARAEETDDEAKLSEMSQRINAGQDVFKAWLSKFQGSLVEAGGDEGLGKVQNGALESIEEFRQMYQETVGATVTVGVGNKISEATKARMLGKLKGKNQVCYFDPNTTEKELALRLQDQTEADKINAARSPA